MLKRILIANRGEIACRIIQTCRKMGIETVAVYSGEDKDALHVRMADRAYGIEEYTGRDEIVSLASAVCADAVHPGYGFFSEDPDFAEVLESKGIVFIGPGAKTIEIMGDKLRALAFAKKCGVPTLPRSPLISENMPDKDVLRIAEKIGLPLLVKSARGGGGMGIEIVHSLPNVVSAVSSVRSVSERRFGNPDLYLERYAHGASHVEVQILGDAHGNVVHLFTRDCSIQRRSQKIIEEGPCTKIDEDTEKFLYKCALALAKKARYVSVGSVEFLVTQKGDIYFLEMNTRIQVEHPVSEMITGLDLVELQIRIASGEPISFRQKDIHINGHAIEARIYPEILHRGIFLPKFGVVNSIKMPREIDGLLRLDSALCKGYVVSSRYEPLMAKLVCWGESREDARKRISSALESFRIYGMRTNINVLKAIVDHEAFRKGIYNTGFLKDKQTLDYLEISDINKSLWDNMGYLA